MSLKTVDQLNVQGRRVFVRVDFNVPRDKASGRILDDTRIREALPTIQYLMDMKAKIVLASHLGRPKGRDESLSLVGVAEKLAEILGCEVLFPEDCVGDGVRKLVHDVKESQVLLLENLRFHRAEEANEPDFSKALAQTAEVYVNDAFGTMHRAHASTVGMTAHFKEKGIGLLVKKELEYLSPLLNNPQRPYAAVLGGAKVSDKIVLIEQLVGKVDKLILGGGLAYTFLLAKGQDVGRSKVEDAQVVVAQRILKKADDYGVHVYLPVDHRVADRFAEDAKPKVVKKIGDEDMGLDIGPETEALYADVLKKSQTIFWNGPMGVFEWKNFSSGSRAVAVAMSESEAITIIGGGESLAAAKQAGVAEKITHLSTGGGAALEFLEGKGLPGLKALEI